MTKPFPTVTLSCVSSSFIYQQQSSTSNLVTLYLPASRLTRTHISSLLNTVLTTVAHPTVAGLVLNHPVTAPGIKRSAASATSLFANARRLALLSVLPSSSTPCASRACAGSPGAVEEAVFSREGVWALLVDARAGGVAWWESCRMEESSEATSA